MNCSVIHITGASGAGTSTLGKAISDKYGYSHLDTDDFFWEPTNPPFSVKRDRKARQNLLKEAIEKAGRCVISGSLDGWGDIFIPRFELVVFLSADKDTRLQRLSAREFQRFGARIQPGGDMYRNHEDFIKWAAAYDVAGLEIRSKRLHEEWLKQVSCPIVRLNGALSCEENMKKLEGYLV
jgi:adenylate kinase family enzyme